MAAPMWGNPCAAVVTNGVLKITDDGDWFNNEGNPIPWRCPFIQNYETGEVLFGTQPAGRTVLEQDFPGKMKREDVFRIALQVNPGVYRVRMFAGSEYIGWADSYGQNFIEWGGVNPGTGAQVNETIVHADSPPVQAPAELDELLGHLDRSKNLWLATTARKRVMEENPNTYPQTKAGLHESELDQAIWLVHKMRGDI